MKVHVIRSAFFNKKEHSQIIKLLKSKPGPIEFIDVSKDTHSKVWAFENEVILAKKDGLSVSDYAIVLDEVDICAEWDFFFKLCDIYREQNQISKNDFVVLLTPHYNFENWFTSFADNSNNIFAHTKDWEYYLSCSPVYPITYLVMSQVIQKTIFKTVDVKRDHAHKKAIGCINDMCEYKADISLKLRTADICPVCLPKLSQDGENDNLISQAFSLFEKIRKEMLHKQHHKPKPSKLHITSSNEIKLINYGNRKIDLGPLEKTVFFFYLMHPDGIENINLPKYRFQFEKFYRTLHNNIPSVKIGAIKKKLQGADMKVIEAAIEEAYKKAEIRAKKKFDDSIESLVCKSQNSMSEKRNHIKKEFVKKIGEEAANYYIVIGAKKKPYKISLDRSLVACDSELFEPGFFLQFNDQSELLVAENQV